MKIFNRRINLPILIALAISFSWGHWGNGDAKTSRIIVYVELLFILLGFITWCYNDINQK